MKLRTRFLVGIVGLVLASLAACTPGGNGAASSPGAAAPAGSAPASSAVPASAAPASAAPASGGYGY
jgi:hypothetical protein